MNGKFNNKQHKINEGVSTLIKLREYSVEIVELFEEVLDKHGIIVPDEDRTGDESEACLYGTTYYDLEDDVLSVLCRLILRVQKLPDADFDIENL